MFLPAIIEKLQESRRKIFQDYDKITLDRGAVEAVAYLFFNPECQSDINLFDLPGQKIKLKDLGNHIITAAPSTLAKYAQRHNLKHLTQVDILRCFALDHAVDVAENKIDQHKNPYYALAHILNVSKVSRVYQLQNVRFADLWLQTPWGKIVFKKVIIPPKLAIEVNQDAYHHFGVVIGQVTDNKLAAEIIALQKNDQFMNQLQRISANKQIEIDFSSLDIFERDVVGQILHPGQVKTIRKPQDLVKQKIKFQN